MALTRREVRELYRRRAANYDLTARLYRLLGFDIDRYRRLAVDALRLDAGDTVVELACGTGLNFPLIEERIGPGGRLIGVDLTDAMLAKARERVLREGWSNVELVHSDVAEYEIPDGVDGILSTAAITLLPEYDAVVGRARGTLAPGGRLVVLDFKEPEGWPEWLVRFWVWIASPFGVTRDLAARHPWESIARRFPVHATAELYGGLVYVAVGEKEQGGGGSE